MDNVWKLKLYNVLLNSMFFLPVIVLLWQETGLSMTQIMILQSLFAISVSVLEVPTGYLSDTYGRKNTIAWSAFFSLAGIITYSFAYDFWIFLLAELFWAIAVSLFSGSDSALVYDTLKAAGREKEYKKIWGSIFFYRMIALAIASVVGGFLGEYSYRWTFYLMIPFMLALLPTALSFTEPPRKKILAEKGYLRELITVFSTLLRRRETRWLFLYAGVIIGFNNGVLWLYQPYFEFTGLSIIAIGVIFGSFQIFSGIISKYSYLLEKYLHARHPYYLLIILVGGSYLLMGNLIYLWSFSFAFLQQAVRGFSKVFFTDILNGLVDSSIRATALSTLSLFERLFYALLIPFVGYAVDVFSLTFAMTIMGFAILFIGTIIVLAKPKAL